MAMPPYWLGTGASPGLGPLSGRPDV